MCDSYFDLRLYETIKSSFNLKSKTIKALSISERYNKFIKSIYVEFKSIPYTKHFE